MSNKGWKNVNAKVYFPTVEELAALRDEYENSDVSMSCLAAKFNTTKGTIVGMARRRWKQRRARMTPPTLNDRLDALHTKLDIIECQDAGHRTNHTR